VDGSKVYLYGEGFDFGEVANNALVSMPGQKNLFGNGIGTFNDRIRDGIAAAVRSRMSVVTRLCHRPLYLTPSNFTNQGTASSAQLGTLLEYTDWIEVGLAGNLRDWNIHRSHGRNGHRRAGQLQRPSRRLHRQPCRGHQLLLRSRATKRLRRRATQIVCG